MKKIALLLLATVMILSLVACKSDDKPDVKLPSGSSGSDSGINISGSSGSNSETSPNNSDSSQETPPTTQADVRFTMFGESMKAAAADSGNLNGYNEEIIPEADAKAIGAVEGMRYTLSSVNVSIELYRYDDTGSSGYYYTITTTGRVALDGAWYEVASCNDLVLIFKSCPDQLRGVYAEILRTLTPAGSSSAA